jgi:hypothetical protein
LPRRGDRNEAAVADVAAFMEGFDDAPVEGVGVDHEVIAAEEKNEADAESVPGRVAVVGHLSASYPGKGNKILMVL